ncbi:hypothetical protein [Sphingomonas sp. UYP23]
MAYMPYVGGWQDVEDGTAVMRDLADLMLAMTDQNAWSAKGNAGSFVVSIAGTQIDFDRAAPAIGLKFERLAAAVEAAIAYRRARNMIEVAGVSAQPLPLWLVSGSDVLAQYVHWTNTSDALRKVLMMTDSVGVAPVVGYLDRRARRDLGQGGARIRVRGGTAIAERIELSDHPRCTASLGESAYIHIETHKLPDVLISALQRDARDNALRPLAEVISHPFFASANLKITGVANDGTALVFEVESSWTPLEPVPAVAWGVLPPDADSAFPWRATARERRALDGLVDEARHRVAATRDPR